MTGRLGHGLRALQRDDGEDGPAVHAPHAAAVAHVIVQDGGAFRSHLWEGREASISHHGNSRNPPPPSSISPLPQSRVKSSAVVSIRFVNHVKVQQPNPGDTGWHPQPAAYLGRLVGDHNAVPEGVAVVDVLSPLAALDSDQVTFGGGA